MKALKTLDAALEKFGGDERLRDARRRAEKRHSPLIPFLSHKNFLNRELGKWWQRLVKRRRSKRFRNFLAFQIERLGASIS